MKKNILCHRGVDRSKENSFESLTQIKNIKNPNYNIGIELDLQMTLDNYLVCYHDKLLPNGKPLYDSFFRELENIDPLENIMIDLQNCDDGITTSNQIINIEIKCYIDNLSYIDSLLGALFDMLDKINSRHQILLTSLNDYVIFELEKRNPKYMYGFIQDDFLGVSQPKTDIICINKRGYDKIPGLAMTHRYVLVYTIFNIERPNEEIFDNAVIKYFLNYPNIILITDDYYKLSQVLRE